MAEWNCLVDCICNTRILKLQSVIIEYGKRLKSTIFTFIFIFTYLLRNVNDGCCVAPVMGDNGEKYRITNTLPKSFTYVRVVILQYKDNQLQVKVLH